MQFEADFYDGISPRAKRVLVNVANQMFVFKTSPTTSEDALTAKYQHHLISTCTIQAKLGSGKRLIDLPDGGRLETDYQDLESCIPGQTASLFWRAVHYAETHKAFIVIALVGILASSVLLLQYGVPLLAKYAAMATPVEVENDLGKQTLATLDQKQLGYFETSHLVASRQDAIKAALSSMCDKSKTCPQYQLNFRKSEVIGPNAFALPGGYVVITDALVALSKNDDELVAVLAHELGHVKKRHALRQTLQGTLSGLIIIAITGDVSSIASGLPALMLNLRYTRDLETEADHYSLAALDSACIPTKAFATILLRLEKSHGNSNTAPEMVSSHPDTIKRVQPFLHHKSTC
ncbi:MAG TPA: hypothetical protein DCO68_08750 [Methylophilaceae bacterium]|nr:hypothetical protein [Methylophilaceae bacterium]HAJ72152.1 hypothetical protein [Methylophilaceae bacterium]